MYKIGLSIQEAEKKLKELRAEIIVLNKERCLIHSEVSAQRDARNEVVRERTKHEEAVYILNKYVEDLSKNHEKFSSQVQQDEIKKKEKIKELEQKLKYNEIELSRYSGLEQKLKELEKLEQEYSQKVTEKKIQYQTLDSTLVSTYNDISIEKEKLNALIAGFKAHEKELWHRENYIINKEQELREREEYLKKINQALVEKFEYGKLNQ